MRLGAEQDGQSSGTRHDVAERRLNCIGPIAIAIAIRTIVVAMMAATQTQYWGSILGVSYDGVLGIPWMGVPLDAYAVGMACHWRTCCGRGYM